MGRKMLVMALALMVAFAIVAVPIPADAGQRGGGGGHGGPGGGSTTVNNPSASAGASAGAYSNASATGVGIGTGGNAMSYQGPVSLKNSVDNGGGGGYISANVSQEVYEATGPLSRTAGFLFGFFPRLAGFDPEGEARLEDTRFHRDYMRKARKALASGLIPIIPTAAPAPEPAAPPKKTSDADDVKDAAITMLQQEIRGLHKAIGEMQAAKTAAKPAVTAPQPRVVPQPTKPVADDHLEKKYQGALTLAAKLQGQLDGLVAQQDTVFKQAEVAANKVLADQAKKTREQVAAANAKAEAAEKRIADAKAQAEATAAVVIADLRKRVTELPPRTTVIERVAPTEVEATVEVTVDGGPPTIKIVRLR